MRFATGIRAMRFPSEWAWDMMMTGGHRFAMPDDYRELAAKCRALAERINDPRTVDVLRKLALEYDSKAAAVLPEKKDDGPLPQPDH